MAARGTRVLAAWRNQEVTRGWLGEETDSSAQGRRGRGAAAAKQEQNILRELPRAGPHKSQMRPHLPPPLFQEQQRSCVLSLRQACLRLLSPPARGAPAWAPARTEGRPRAREGEAWKERDSSAGRPRPLKKTEAGRKTYCSLQSDHLCASLWVTHPGTPRPRGKADEARQENPAW